ncbi:hypothetical protein QXB71_002646 [Vibrio cholerae]|nr:hypothetical protein [Vibrio cholerae]
MCIDSCHISVNRTIPVDKQNELESKKFVELAKQSLLRDDYQCRFCGFKAKGAEQQVITINGLYREDDFRLDNLTTVCPYCFLGQRLGHSAITDEITFIYAPEITQAQLNQLMRLLYFYQAFEIEEQDEYQHKIPDEVQSIIDLKDQSNAILTELRERVKLVSKQFDYCSLTHLKTLTTFLFDLPNEKYELRNKFFQNIRYLIKPETLASYNELYAKTVFKTMNGHKEIIESLKVTVVDRSIFD